MGKKTKIEWCDSTWSPVTGCLHGCEYCYARRYAKRFGGNQMPIFTDKPVLREPYLMTDGEYKTRICPYPFDFTPTFHRYKLDEAQKWKKPRTIFVCSMADLFGDWVPDEWIQEVFSACEKAPQHRYLFLTKNPKRYLWLANKGLLPDNDKLWFGYSATMTKDIKPVSSAIKHSFISFEPMLERIDPTTLDLIPMNVLTDWVILGAETGNRKDKVVPKREWVDVIVGKCIEHNVPIFMKESLRDLMGADFRQEFPWR